MFREVRTYHGYCCQFDINYFKENAQNGTEFVSGIKMSEALDIIVNEENITPDGVVTDGSIMLFIFDAKDNVSLLDSSIIISQGGYFDVNFGVWAIDASDSVKELNIRSRNCVLETDDIHGPGYYFGCISAIIVKKLVETCKCIPSSYNEQLLKLKETYPRCLWEQLSCIYLTFEKVTQNIKTIFTESECYQRCNYVQYDSDVKYLRQQRNFNDLNGNYSRISVHFASHTCMKYRRELLYTWDQMLANLGGIFGLCLGGSIISIIEMVWFLFDILYATVTYRKNVTKVNDFQKNIEKPPNVLSLYRNRKVWERNRFIH
ncbi:uncharacterized protein LOC113509176 [Galleria mellonella]|uniref:Uncharacterized protein LOC113509176 n=1 Tax=Galleria mellonella TaxID=7137 RepID=A0ABM3MG74_GALME|nr:uncharacterized protein LOC113509176 [Galleria mellonella]